MNALPHSQIIAIDPGLTGALAWLGVDKADGRLRVLAVADMPTFLKKTGTSTRPKIDLPRLVQLFQSPLFAPTLAVIEEVGAAPGQGVTSMFNFGYGAGLVAGCAAASGLDVHTVRPQHWQKWARKRPGKGAAREHAVALFPDLTHKMKRAKDHGRADAVLIGYAYFSEKLQALPKT